MMLSGITLVMLLIQPETLTSRILRDMAARLNKEKKCHYYIAPADQNRLSVLATLVSPRKLLLNLQRKFS